MISPKEFHHGTAAVINPGSRLVKINLWMVGPYGSREHTQRTFHVTASIAFVTRELTREFGTGNWRLRIRRRRGEMSS